MGTVSVNMLTVVHKTSGGTSIIFPDVCKTPTPGGPVPIPYPNIATSADTDQGSKKVKMDGNEIMLKGSNFKKSSGDEAGTANGLVSNKIMGKAYPKMYSMDVKVEGDNVMRLSDIMLHNGSSPTNTPPTPEVQSPSPVPPTAEPDPEIPRVTRLWWEPAECCCGDVVEACAETEHFEDGWRVAVGTVFEGNLRAVPSSRYPRVEGNVARRRWGIRRGTYRPQSALGLRATGLGLPCDSTEDLRIVTAEPASEVVIDNRSTPRYVQSTTPTGTVWAPDGANYEWEYGYEIKIDNGELVITRKIDFDRKNGARAPNKRKREWKREIEQIWDRKYKLHRTGCSRGRMCDCGVSNGCCVWAIRIYVDWGRGHGRRVELHRGANSPTDWGGPNWWYSHTWWEERAGVPQTVRAHEFGHLIGMYDEYEAGACDPGRVYTNEPTSIMGAGSYVFNRHFEDYKTWFDGRAGSVVGEVELLRI